MNKQKSLVALAKEATPQESVSRVFDLMGGVNNLIEEGSTVVLKPNIGHIADPKSAVITSPEVIRAVIHEVKKAKPGRIIIAEAAAIGCDTMKCFEAGGITQLAEEEGVELIDIKRDKDLVDVAVRGYRSNISHVKLPRFLLAADHIINLPILKAHASMVFSCALKNIKGVVQDRVHMDMHAENLTMAMMDVWWAVRADINIVDAIYAAGGYSPHMPVPEYIGCIIGGKDPVAVDRVACDLASIDINKVSYFKVAEECGLGNIDYDGIELVGEKIEDCAIHLWVPYLRGMDSWPEYNILYENACSSCQALLALNMETMKAIGEYDKHTDMTIVIGRKDSIPEDIPHDKLILHGNCLRKFKDRGLWSQGCPPAEGALKDCILDGKPIDASEMDRLRQRADQERPVWQAYVYEQSKKYHEKLSKK